MKKLQIGVLALLLCGSWQAESGTSALRNAMRGEVAKTSQHLLAGITSLSLFFGAAALTANAHKVPHAERQAQLQHLYQAEQQATVQHDSLSESGSQPPGSMQGWQGRLGAHGEEEEENALAWSEEVTMSDGVFYISLRNPNYEHMHHVIYFANTLTGEPLLAGFYLDGHEEDYISLYAHDGLVAKGFVQRDLQVFPDPLDLYAKVTVFTIDDLFLGDRYKPILPIAPEEFPLQDVGAELRMLQYGKNKDDPATYANLPLQQRNCEVLEPNVWGKVGIMRHSCTPIKGAHSSFGAPILNTDGRLVGFFSESTPTGANIAEGMTVELFNYLLSQQTNPTAVDAKDKLAVTWGELKKLH